MKIKTRTFSKAQLNAKQKINSTILMDAITRLEAKPEFQNTIGALLLESGEDASIQISAFEPTRLSNFVTQLMSEIVNEGADVVFPKKSVENLWAPTWTTIILL